MEMFRLTLNGLLPNEVIDSLCRWVANVINLAETEAEERVRTKAHKIIKEMMTGIFQGDMPRKIADEFIQKLNADDNDYGI